MRIPNSKEEVIMRTLRAYVDLDSIDFTRNYQLPLETSHHLARVLRVKPNQSIEIFDGKGRLFDAQITNLGKQVSIQLFSEKKSSVTESACQIQLMLSVGKGEKMDWILQKATELGVHSITPILSARCEVRLDKDRWQKKMERWREIIINACEQCGRNTLPVIHEIQSLSTGLQSCEFRLKLLLHPDKANKSLSGVLEDNNLNQVTLLIGPEGGFDDDEVALAKAHAFVCVSLGPRILRMETAAIASIAILQAFLGDICKQS